MTVLQLSDEENLIIRSPQHLFYSKNSGSRVLRFRRSLQGEKRRLYLRTSEGTEKEMLKFSEAYAAVRAVHLLPSGNCAPKSAERWTKLFKATYYYPGICYFAKNIWRVCKKRLIIRKVKDIMPYVPKRIMVAKLMKIVQMDLIDMAPGSILQMRGNIVGFRYVITITECLSRYCFLFPLQYKSAEEVRPMSVCINVILSA